MTTTLFVLGNNGAGKSTALEEGLLPVLREAGLSAGTYNLYNLLLAMKQQGDRRIEPVFVEGEERGFFVCDTSAYAVLPARLEQVLCNAPHTRDIQIVEYAVQNPWEDFRGFSPGFLSPVFFLSLGTPARAVQEARIQRRNQDPTKHYLVPEVIERYSKPYEHILCSPEFQQAFSLDSQRITCLANEGNDKAIFVEQVRAYAWSLARLLLDGEETRDVLLVSSPSLCDLL